MISTTIASLNQMEVKTFLMQSRINSQTLLSRSDVYKRQEYIDTIASPYEAAKASLIEDVVAPADTRDAIITALDMLASKRVSKLPKKHSN